MNVTLTETAVGNAAFGAFRGIEMAHGHRIGCCHIELLTVGRERVICATDLRILLPVDVLPSSGADSDPVDQAARVDDAISYRAATLHQTASKRAGCHRARVALVLRRARRVEIRGQVLLASPAQPLLLIVDAQSAEVSNAGIVYPVLRVHNLNASRVRLG